MSEKRALVWFKNNLRLHDNEVLVRACTQATFVLPVYIFDPRHFQRHTLGFPKSSYWRTQFLLQSVADLRSSLQRRGANLHVWMGKPEEILPALAKQLKITAVYASREVTSEELQAQTSVEQGLKSIGIPLELFWQNTLYHVDDIPWPIRHLPDTFTFFRKELENESRVRSAFAIPDYMAYQKEIELGEIPKPENFGLPTQHIDDRAALICKGGETEGLKRVHTYLWQTDSLRQYKETRNELLGANYSSKFSAWLALGCLSPIAIYEEVLRYEQERVKNDSTYWLIFELLWRDYFRFAAKKYGNAIFQVKGTRNKIIDFKNDIALFEKWRSGQTGVPFIDANMKELMLTGFMSNRGRQNVACYLAKDLHVNWTWGAAWFESQLIDYDVSSNWLNWAYIAGVGNDPREDRYFNTESQVTKYDPKGEYTTYWLGAAHLSDNAGGSTLEIRN